MPIPYPRFSWKAVLFLVLGTIYLCSTVSQAQTSLFDCTTNTDNVPVSECDALVALYAATDGANWQYRTNNFEPGDAWLTTSSPCAWYGVRCNNVGQVTELWLYGSCCAANQNFGMMGDLPPAIGELVHLEVLVLNYNQLTSLPAEIGNLSSLRALQLDGNQLTELPAEIGNLVSLRDFGLNQNYVQLIPPEIGNLSDLRRLIWAGNGVTDLPDELWNLTNLIELSLFNNRLTTLSPEISNLDVLQKLWLGRNQLSDVPPQIASSAELTVLDLSYNQLSDVPSTIDQLTQLISLNLSDNQLSQLPFEFTNSTALTYLRLQNNVDLNGRLSSQLTQYDLLELTFENTQLCESAAPDFQAWLDAIPSVSRTNLTCSDVPTAVSPQHQMTWVKSLAAGPFVLLIAITLILFGKRRSLRLMRRRYG